MITDDEVLRLFERADPAQTDDAAPAIDAAGYLDALRTRSSTVTYIDTEPTPTEPPTNHHRWLAAAAAAATVAVIAGGLVLASPRRRRDGGRVRPGTGRHRDRVRAAPTTEAPVTTPPPRPADESAAAEGPVGTRVGFIGLPPEGATPSTLGGREIVVSMRSCYAPIGELSDDRRVVAARGAVGPRRRTADLAEVRGSSRGCELAVDGSARAASHTRGRRAHAVRSDRCAQDSGEPHRCDRCRPRHYYVPAGRRLDGNTFSAGRRAPRASHGSVVVAAGNRLGGPRDQGLRAIHSTWSRSSAYGRRVPFRRPEEPSEGTDGTQRSSLSYRPRRWMSSTAKVWQEYPGSSDTQRSRPTRPAPLPRPSTMQGSSRTDC